MDPVHLLVRWDRKHREHVLWIMDAVYLLAPSLLGSETWLSSWLSLSVLLHSLSPVCVCVES